MGSVNSMKEKNPNRKPLAIAAMVLALVAVLAGGLALILHGCGRPQIYSGYLICQKCGMTGKCAMDNIDLTVHPEQYTLKCAKMADCIVSGYGIAVKQGDGKYRYYRFDSVGSAMALDNVIYTTKRTDNLLVEVKGTLKGDTITVSSIELK
jgi:hypothetical protein